MLIKVYVLSRMLFRIVGNVVFDNEIIIEVSKIGRIEVVKMECKSELTSTLNLINFRCKIDWMTKSQQNFCSISLFYRLMKKYVC